MFLDHCVSLLSTGHSPVRQEFYSDHAKVLFKLQSGVKAKRLDSIPTVLLMIEAIKATQRHLDQAEQFKRFDNFINYAFDNFAEPVAMAFVKYAISDRKLTIKKLAESSSWSMISRVFKPVLLEDSKDPAERAKFAKFERHYQRLKKYKEVSDMLADYAKGEAANIEQLATVH